MSARVAVVVQARTGSTRLPGKVLRPLAGAPMLQRQLERIQASASRFELVVATTRAPEDDAIAALCGAIGVRCLRGHASDLIDRHVQAARAVAADVVGKVPADCPLVDPDAIDRVLAAFAAGGCDYASNLHPPSWPDGNDVEVMSRDTLELSWREAQRPFEREHTTPFVWDQPERFRLRNVVLAGGLDLSRRHRFTVDYPEDLQLVSAVYESLWSPGRVFTLDDVLALMHERPALRALNAKYAGVNWYRDHLHELKTVGAADTRMPTVDAR